MPEPITDEVLLQSPKVELHVHLEGTITAATAAELARAHGEDPAVVLPLEKGDYPRRFASFLQFVELYQAVSRQVRTPDDLRTVAQSFAEQRAVQNILYSEVHFTAATHVRNGMEPAAMWAALVEGFSAAPDVTIRLIVDAIRDLGSEHGHQTVALVREARDVDIAGLGLSGVEGSVPEREFVMLRETADELGLGLSVHAGETGGPGNITAALDDLRADRIGHGVAAARDPGLVERLAGSGTPVEVCPSSNVSLGVFPSLEVHPFGALWEAGVNVTVNSDDPPFFSTTLTEELVHAVGLASLDLDGVALLQRRAAAAAFATQEVKERLERSIDAWTHGLSS